jgi:hypothetical protein
VRARGGEAEHLGVHAVLGQHLLAVVDVAVAADGDVVIAGVMQAGIAIGIDGDAHGAGARLQRLQVSGRVKVVVEINDSHQWLPCRRASR